MPETVAHYVQRIRSYLGAKTRLKPCRKRPKALANLLQGVAESV